jgi:hypothetical protein
MAADDFDLVDSAIVCRRLEITREGGATSQVVKEYLHFPPRRTVRSARDMTGTFVKGNDMSSIPAECRTQSCATA